MGSRESRSAPVIRSCSGDGWGGPAFKVESAGGTGGRTRLQAFHHVVTACDRFVFLIEPTWSPERPVDPGVLETWQLAGYASTGVSVDLEFDDGTFLSELGAVDQYGNGVQARRQGASRCLRTDQWNRVAVDLAPAIGRTVVAAHADVACAPGQALRALIVLRGVERANDDPRFGAELVDTRRGSDSVPAMSRGNTYPCAALPNASAFVAPMTDRHETGWIYRYTVESPALEAFIVTRLPSPWIGDHGSLQFFPATSGPDGTLGWHRLGFRREEETARPHTYAVTFENGISVRLVAGLRASAVEIDFAGREPVLVIGPTNGEGRIELDTTAANELVASSDFVSLSVTDAPRTFYSLIASATVVDSWVDADGQQFFRFDGSAADQRLTLRIGWSYLGLEQARSNVISELGFNELELLEQRSRETWDAVLGRVTLEGATATQRESFYSCLYRILLFPNIAFDEPDGIPRHPSQLSRAASGQGSSPGADGPLSIGGGFWDTYRTTWPAYFLLAPARAALLLDGFVQHYVEHGWIPRWSGPGPIDCMVGTNSDAVFADASAKGIPIGHPRHAYEAALKNATVPSESPNVGRKGLARSPFVGFTSTDIHEGLSWTMEGAICDAAIAEWASRLRDAEPHGSAARERYAAEAQYFSNRALSYRTLFDERHGFFIGRTPTGDFRDTTRFDPAVWGGDYAETNAWGMAHSAPHDGDGLARLHGGRGGLGASLDALFDTTAPPLDRTMGSYPFVIHEMVEARDVRMGLWAPSNQPAHHTPFMYLFSDRPHRTQALVREAVRRLFVGGDNGQGYPGDEDNGEMSAWYVFLSVGLYPLAPGTGLYAITSPSVGRVSIELENGRTLTVTALGHAPQNDYIQAVTVNGEPWAEPFISHDVLTAGCEIEIELGPTPTRWGLLPDELERREPLVDVTGSVPSCSSTPDDVGILIDNDSAQECRVGSGWWFSSEPGRRPIVMYTLTSGASDPGPRAWRLQGSDDAETWSDLDVRAGESFEWARMIRPFRVAAPRPFGHVRLLIEADGGSLSQIEMFVESAAVQRQQ